MTRQGHIKPPIPWSAERERKRIKRETGAVKRERERAAESEPQIKRKRERGEREGETGERERERGEREREGKKEKNYKHKKIHGILSCHASIRLP